MNPSHPSLFPAFSRRAAIRPASGLILVSSVLLLTVGALTAAPTPTPKPGSSPAMTPAATPTPAATVAASATPAPDVKVTYNGTQQTQYLGTARDAFIADRQAASQPFVDAHNALETAGGLGSKGLTSKDAITARRDLVAKCIAANEVYLTFIKGQVETYRAELAKTPLVPNDVNSVADEFAKNQANTDALVKMHETERDALKAGDGMLAALDKSYGSWSLEPSGKLMFKKKSAAGAYSEQAEKYNTLAKAGEAMRTQLTNANAIPSASVPPNVVPGASATASPAATASASVGPAATVTPTPSAKPTPAAKPGH